MRRIKIQLAYDGGGFHGWQIQPGLPTIQGALEEIVSAMEGAPVAVAGSGRCGWICAHSPESCMRCADDVVAGRYCARLGGDSHAARAKNTAVRIAWCAKSTLAGSGGAETDRRIAHLRVA